MTSVLRLTKAHLTAATTHLSNADPRLGRVIAAVGACTMLPTREGTHFAHLARAIVYQQLSGSAAATIHARVCAALGGAPDAERIAAVDDITLRSAGLSQAKMRALQDLSARVLDGRVVLDRIERSANEEIIEHLVQVRGIGPWTAQMFLMFRLGRPDVLPVLDLGVRKGAQLMHRLRTVPDAARLEKLARSWQPWRSVASWYCWRVLDLDAAGAWPP